MWPDQSRASGRGYRPLQAFQPVSKWRAMEETTLLRLGAALRKVPGGGLPLAARNRWRTRQRRLAAERRETEFAERDRRRLESLAGANDLRLNIGSSNMHVEGWINADLHRDP